MTRQCLLYMFRVLVSDKTTIKPWLYYSNKPNYRNRHRTNYSLHAVFQLIKLVLTNVNDLYNVLAMNSTCSKQSKVYNFEYNWEYRTYKTRLRLVFLAQRVMNLKGFFSLGHLLHPMVIRIYSHLQVYKATITQFVMVNSHVLRI